MPLKVYDETLRVLRHAVEQAKLDRSDELAALRRLDEQCRISDAAASGRPLPASATAIWSALVERERARSRSLGGRTCMDDAPKLRRRARQLSLPF